MKTKQKKTRVLKQSDWFLFLTFGFFLDNLIIFSESFFPPALRFGEIGQDQSNDENLQSYLCPQHGHHENCCWIWWNVKYQKLKKKKKKSVRYRPLVIFKCITAIVSVSIPIQLHSICLENRNLTHWNSQVV